MAGKDSAQDKTENATEKRLADARAKADVPRSRELNTFTMLIAALIGFAVFGREAVGSYRQLAASRWSLSRSDLFNDAAVLNGFYESLINTLWLGAPFLVVMFVSSFVGPVLMGGWVFSVQSLKFDVAKLNPLSGLKRMFGIQGFADLIKAIIKVLLLGSVAVFLLLETRDEFLLLGDMPLDAALNSAFRLLFQISLVLALTMALVVLLDVPYQIWNHARKLRMTRQEVRDEHKETSGNPEIKAKVRSLQQTISQRRMLLDVPTADVIVVNPTHFSVALKYEEGSSAPRVIAKGVDHQALRIREIAKHSNVPLFSAPVLARALYRHTDLGDSIPTELYLAVAQILAYVFQIKQANLADQRRLQKPTDLHVPSSLRDPE